MDVGAILPITISVVALAGGAVGYYGKARGDSIIKYQANEISLRDGTIARLEKDNAAIQARSDTLGGELKHFKERNQELIELAQGAPQLKNLTAAVEALVKTVNEKLS